jgi:hypothetical protein
MMRSSLAAGASHACGMTAASMDCPRTGRQARRGQLDPDRLHAQASALSNIAPGGARRTSAPRLG